MGKKKNTTKNKQKSQRQSVFGKFSKIFFVLFLIIFWGIIRTIQKNIGDKKIKSDNNITTGWVYDKGVGRRVNDIRHYYFFVNGEKYTGMSSYDEDLNVGDQIKVVYYPEDPSINRSWNSYTEIQKK